MKNLTPLMFIFLKATFCFLFMKYTKLKFSKIMTVKITSLTFLLCNMFSIINTIFSVYLSVLFVFHISILRCSVPIGVT